MSSVRATSIEHKPRIAFLGAGVGLHAEQGGYQGLPMLTALLERLAVDFDVVIYSLIRVKEVSVPKGIRLRQITTLNLPHYLKYMLLVITFASDHMLRPFAIINAISAFPAGRIAVVLGRVFRRPVFVHLIGSETAKILEIGYGDLLVPRLSKIVNWVCRKTEVLITLTEYHKNITEKNLGLYGKALMLPRRPDLKKFPYHERSISFPVKFLHVASYQPFKDQQTLFHAFATISKQLECTLTVLGHGFDNPGVRQLVTDLEIDTKVKFEGIVRHDEIWRYFQDAHILLHTSLYESLCGAVQEAMASGVPVCGTDVGILADLGEPFAVVVPIRDPDELANRSLALIRDGDRYHRQQKLARDYMVNHDAEWAAKKYKELFVKWIK